MAVALFTASLSLLHVPANAARRSTKPTEQAPAPVGPGEITSKEMGAAVRSAALPLAVNLGVSLGEPTCSSGAKRNANLAAQCTVLFDRVPVPYIVTYPNGSLAATPLFLVVSKKQLEQQLAASGSPTCGKETVIVVPSGGSITCTSGKRGVDITISGTQASWTAKIGAATKPPPTKVETTTKAKKGKKKR